MELAALETGHRHSRIVTDSDCRSDERGVMLKYNFSVTTRNGQKVDNIQIQGKDLQDAERKLRQMYHQCEVMSCKTVDMDKKILQSADIEEVLSLIVKGC